MPRVASKDQQARGKIQLFSKWAFAQFFVLSCVFPFRHGARPVSTKYNVCTKIHLLGDDTSNFLFFLVSFPSDTGHAPSLQNTTFVQKHIFGCLHVKLFCFFWCLSLPTRGTPRLYEIHLLARPVSTKYNVPHVPRMYRNTFFCVPRLYKNATFWGCLHTAMPLWMGLSK